MSHQKSLLQTLRDALKGLLLQTLLLSLLLLTACAGYDVTVNEKVVYSPAPVLRGLEVPDNALRACLQEAISAESISRATELKTLNCSHAGISNLSGLAAFTGLQRLKLSANDIRNLVELEKLKELRELLLDKNRIVDPVPLYRLPQLTSLDLSGNPELQCPREAGFATVDSVLLPKHCY